MKNYSKQSMYEIYKDFENENLNKELIEFEILNPDIKHESYSGQIINVDSEKYIYRGYKSWIDLAERFNFKMLTPILKNENFVIIKFKKLNDKKSFHLQNSGDSEKYGIDSIFSKINKNEEPDFFINYYNALKNVNITKRKRVLNLGVNSGEEFELICKMCSNFSQIELVGIDFCSSAIDEAEKRFGSYKNVIFYKHDINSLEELDLGSFDLIISIGTLQSSNLNFKKTFMNIVQNHLNKDGNMILGFPNCRWIDGNIIYGAKPKNYNFAEMSVLVNDAFFCKKYLQQKKFRVTLTGKYYLFLTATSIRK
jgi:SAM-dependent methyltransferase